MKLVLVISSLETGGAERVLSTLANTWVQRGWEILLVTTHDSGDPPFYPLDDRVHRRPMTIDQVGASKWAGNLRRIKKLRRLFQEEKPDFVVSFLNFTNILVLLAGWGLDLKVMVSERADPGVMKIGMFWGTLRRLVYPKARVLVCQTEAAARFFRPWMGEKVAVIPNPVTRPISEGSRGDFILPHPAIVAMGRLHPVKGFSDLLNAMVLVHDRFPEWHLTILGEGPLRGKLENLRDSLGLKGVVHFPGRVPDPYYVLKNAELFVLSSISEGFPNALCEAMAAGLPVISTKCPSGPEEIIQDQVNGLLVSVGSPQELSHRILQVLENRELRDSLGKNAELIVETFSLSRVISQWDLVFQ